MTKRRRKGEPDAVYRERLVDENDNAGIRGMITRERQDLEEMREWLMGEVAPAFIISKKDTLGASEVIETMKRFACLASALEAFASVLGSMADTDIDFSSILRDARKEEDK